MWVSAFVVVNGYVSFGHGHGGLAFMMVKRGELRDEKGHFFLQDKMRENVRREENSYRVCLVGGVEKWEDRKYFNFSHFCLVGSEKSGGMEKVSLYKFTYTLLLKNDV